MFTHATIPKNMMGKELNPQEKRVVMNIFESGKSASCEKDPIALWVV